MKTLENTIKEPILIRSVDQQVPGTTRERIEEAFRIGSILYPAPKQSYNLFFHLGDFFHPSVDPSQGVFLCHYPKKE